MYEASEWHTHDISGIDTGEAVKRSDGRCRTKRGRNKVRAAFGAPLATSDGFTTGKYRNPDLVSDYFDKINTNNKAYFLGFIFADGSLSEAEALTIGLQGTDGYILESFASELGLTVGPRTDENPLYTCGSVSTLYVRSDQIYGDLIKLGVIERKSYTDHEVPDLPDNLYPHFTRGYFDGDGCVCWHKAPTKKNPDNRYPEISLVGNKRFLESLREVIPVETKSKLYQRKGCWQYSLSHRKARQFLNWIYDMEPSDLYLHRKYKIYRDIIGRHIDG